MFRWLFGGGDSDPSSSSTSSDSTSTPPPALTSSSLSGDGSSSGPDSPTSSLSSHAGSSSDALPGSGNDRYDPSVLERVASAARELQDSPHADDLFTLMREQERTWQERFSSEREKAIAQAALAASENARVAEEERRRSMQYQTQQEQQRMQYQDQMERKRFDEQLQQQSQVNANMLRQQEESVARQENERRRSIEYDNELRRQTELTKVRADAEARTQQERENRDIRDAQLVLQAEEYRKTVLEAINAAGRTIGEGTAAFLSDPQRVTSAVGLVTALAAGVYATRAAARVAGDYASARLRKPPLVRETSKSNWLLHPVNSAKEAARRRRADGDALKGMVLNDSAATRLRDITLGTARSRRHGANFRHIMLHGPPGTGKTMFARQLAHQSGLDYAILSGGDIGPLGADAPDELHRVFDWAEASRRGLLIFVDEADAFLRKRGVTGDSQMSEPMRSALSTFLYRTGTPTDKFMLVLSTNEPEAFDSAVTDRVDEAVLLDLPNKAELESLLEMYFEEYIVRGAPKAAQIRVDESVKRDWAQVAQRINGFSGRQVSKLAAAWQASAYASIDNSIDQERMEKVLEDHIEQLKVKSEWSKTVLQ